MSDRPRHSVAPEQLLQLVKNPTAMGPRPAAFDALPQPVPMALVVPEKPPSAHARAWTDERLVVREPVAHRVEQVTVGRSCSRMFGCYGGLRNVCPSTLSSHIRKCHDRLVQLLNQWAAAVPKDATCTGKDLLMLTNDLADGDAAIVLLVLSKQKPKAQVYARCVWQGQRSFPPLDVFPQEVRIGTRASRLGNGTGQSSRSFDLMTGDELALELVNKSESWRLYSVEYEIGVEDATLLGMRIKSSEMFRPPKQPAPKARRVAWNADVWDALDLDMDALESRLQPSSSSAASSSQGMPLQQLGALVDALDEEFDFLPDAAGVDCVEVAQDIAAVLREDLMCDEFRQEDLDTGLGAEAEVSEEEASDAPDEAEPEAPAVTATRGAEVDDRGYVRSSYGPWSSLGVVGRLTDWPEKKPREKRNISMKC